VSTRRRLVFAAAIAASLAARAAADPAPDLTKYVHLQSGSHVETGGGSQRDLPPGYFLDEPTFQKLDRDFKACQDDSTHKAAEIKVYKAEIEKWQPGWMTLAGAIVAGAALGWYAHGKL
jgi:hypothetical protein